MANDNERATWRDRLFVGMQYLLPQHALSRIVYRATRSTAPGWKNFLIRSFLRGFDVDMAEAVAPDPFAYASFNAFFTRALRPGARAVDTKPDAVVSPVDGMVSQVGRIDSNLLLQAKGHTYSLDALLAGDGALETGLRGGEFATIYLAPFNYHRIHMPVAGRVVATTHVPGKLFSVNTVTARHVPELFARNERVICVFDTGIGMMVMVLVGALFVGSMETVWAGEITPARRRGPTRLPTQAVDLGRGAEMGRFNMGSTVIVLFESSCVSWNDTLVPGAFVKMGERIGTLTGAAREAS
jgi:phosphatidylserine decarboxylase